MKKIYQKPLTLTMQVELVQMIALSKMEGTANDSDALSRQSIFMDDEQDANSGSRPSVWDDNEEW